MISGIGNSNAMMQMYQAGLQKPTAEEIEAEQEELFAVADEDGDGELSSEEFATLMDSLPTPPAGGMGGASEEVDLEELFSTIDADEDGSVTLEEFTSGMEAMAEEIQPQMGGMQELDLEELFSTMDTDEDGSITQEEFESGMSTLMEEMQAQGGGMMPPPSGGMNPMMMGGGMQSMQTMSSSTYSPQQVQNFLAVYQAEDALYS